MRSVRRPGGLVLCDDSFQVPMAGHAAAASPAGFGYVANAGQLAIGDALTNGCFGDAQAMAQRAAGLSRGLFIGKSRGNHGR
jgi:hypothetical protein